MDFSVVRERRYALAVDELSTNLCSCTQKYPPLLSGCIPNSVNTFRHYHPQFVLFEAIEGGFRISRIMNEALG